ncbi:MAG: HAD family phosphatase [Saprospiraceae bacterium]|nr:HAD family phosphatase [Saprospiraceae bacterium]
MAHSTLKNLIFDLGNVIIDLDFRASEDRLLELANVSFVKPSEEDLQVFIDFECGHIPEAVFLNYLIRRSGGKAQAVDLIRAWTAMLARIPYQRLAMLQSLRRQYQVFILSNTNETHIRWVDGHLKEKFKINRLADLVDRAFYSHDLKTRKPEPDIYLKMLKLANIKPEQSLFFDDHAPNIEAAQKVGIQGHIVSPQDEITEIVPAVLARFQ